MQKYDNDIQMMLDRMDDILKLDQKPISDFRKEAQYIDDHNEELKVLDREVERACDDQFFNRYCDAADEKARREQERSRGIEHSRQAERSRGMDIGF